MMSNPPTNALALAKKHVEGGRRIIAAQEEIVAEVKAKGGNPALSQSMLDSFRQTQAIFEDDLRRLSKDKEGSEETPSNPRVG